MNDTNSNNKLIVPGSKNAIEQMKYEIANELGVSLGADTTSRSNGSVGGQITKKMIKDSQQHFQKRVTNSDLYNDNMKNL